MSEEGQDERVDAVLRHLRYSKEVAQPEHVLRLLKIRNAREGTILHALKEQREAMGSRPVRKEDFDLLKEREGLPAGGSLHASSWRSKATSQ